MADNVTVTPGSGASIATDDVGGIQFQKVKIDVGGDGASAVLSTSDPMPISGPVTVTGDALTALQLLDNVVYTEAATDTTIEGVAILWEDTSDTLRVPSAAKPLPVAIITGAGSGGTAMADDAAYTVAVTSFTPVGGVYKSSVDSVDDGDGGAVAMSATRAMHVHIVGDDVGSAVADEDGTVATGATNVAQTIAVQYEYDGTNLVRTRGQHTVAHDAADAGNPEKLGAKAETSIAGVTLVTDGDRTDLYAGVDGVLITRPHCNLEDIVTGNASNTDGASTQCIAAQAAGVKTYLTTVIVTNSHATDDIYVEIKDGATAKLTIPVPHSSGAAVTLAVPLPGTAATAWNFDPSAAKTTIFCSMVGFKSKV